MFKFDNLLKDTDPVTDGKGHVLKNDWRNREKLFRLLREASAVVSEHEDQRVLKELFALTALYINIDISTIKIVRHGNPAGDTSKWIRSILALPNIPTRAKKKLFDAQTLLVNIYGYRPDMIPNGYLDMLITDVARLLSGSKNDIYEVVTAVYDIIDWINDEKWIRGDENYASAAVAFYVATHAAWVMAAPEDKDGIKDTLNMIRKYFKEAGRFSSTITGNQDGTIERERIVPDEKQDVVDERTRAYLTENVLISDRDTSPLSGIIGDDKHGPVSFEASSVDGKILYTKDEDIENKNIDVPRDVALNDKIIEAVSIMQKGVQDILTALGEFKK